MLTQKQSARLACVVFSQSVLGEQDRLPKSRALNVAISMLASVASRLTGLITQFITAWYLTADEFGLYAIALGITTFTLLMRGGGTGIVFQSMRKEEYANVGGGLLRTSIIFAVLGALLTSGAAMPAEWYYGQKSLGWLLLWMAALSLIQQISFYPRAKMVSSLKFSRLAWIDVLGAIVKLATAFYCAKSGYGALTFVVAQVVAIALQIALTCIWADFHRSDFAVPTHWVQPTIALIRYPLGISIMISLMEQIDSFIASLFVPIASLGIYYFAAQMVTQPMRLVTTTLAGVLAPYGAIARGNKKLEDSNISTAFNAGIIFTPLFVLSIAAVYPSLERLIWGGKWESSILPVTLTAVFLVYPTVQGVLEGPILGMRRWARYIELLSWRTGAKIIGAVVGIVVLKSAALTGASIAITLVVSVGAASSISSYIQSRRIMLESGADRESVHYELWATPLYAILAVVATHGVSSSILEVLTIDPAEPRLIAGVEFALSLLIYGFISIVLLRFAYIGNLKALLFLVPARPRSVVCKLLAIAPEEVSHQPQQH